MRANGDRSLALALLAGLLVLAVHGAARAQAVEPAAQKYIGARGIALGDAIGSDEFDIEAMYQNPATLSFLRRPDIMIDERHVYDDQIFAENIAGRVFANRTTAIGLGAGVEHAGKLTHGGPFNFVQEDLDAGLAYRFPSVSSDLSVGVLGNLRAGKDAARTREAARFSLGLMYSPAPGISYSAIYRGLGTDLAYTAAAPPNAPVTQAQVEQLPKSLELGSTMRYPASSAEPFMTISIAGEKDFTTHVLRIRGGIETIIMDVLSLRMGYVNAEVRQWRLGAGVTVGRLLVDYAVMPVTGAGRFDEVTLKVAF
jgi:hypothetical protein